MWHKNRFKARLYWSHSISWDPLESSRVYHSLLLWWNVSIPCLRQEKAITLSRHIFYSWVFILWEASLLFPVHQTTIGSLFILCVVQCIFSNLVVLWWNLWILKKLSQLSWRFWWENTRIQSNAVNDTYLRKYNSLMSIFFYDSIKLI